ncbi:MAG: AAA family ATPase [Clostridia bacterium]|nr:AAA family ATPase [Clostridia bacterium]
MNYITGIRLNDMPQGYLAKLPAVKHLYQAGELEFANPVTFFVGENGSGKSTLLEAIAVAAGFNPEGGSRDFAFSTKRTHSDLCDYITPIRTLPPKDGFFLRAESFYNTASYLDENSTMRRYGGVSFHEQSHGESFLSLVTNRFEGNGLYIMDEPEAALSPQRLLTLIVLMEELVKSRSQFIIATHSPIIMAFPGADIIQFSEKGMERVTYRETESYRITKQFMDDPERMIKYLLE